MSLLARALLALFFANGAAVVLIWWGGLEPQSLDSLAGRLNAAGRIAGLVGTYLVLVQRGGDPLRPPHPATVGMAAAVIGMYLVHQDS